MNLEQLNSDYGIANQLQFTMGPGNLPVIQISNPHAQATLSVYAGQVLSYRPITATEDLMFVSEKAYFQTGKAIKGGIPICWPWFGPDPEGLGRASHGFVRNRLWSIQATTTTPDQETQVTLGLVDTAETRDLWPHAFSLALEIIVGRTLKMTLITRNTGNQTFALTQALHTYFQIGDISTVSVRGLENTTYLDKVDGGNTKQQSGPVTIATEVDRIYTKVPAELVVEDPTLNRTIHLRTQGSQTAIVWNPWMDKAKSMADFADDEYQRMLCVETANAANEVVNLTPGNEHHLVAHYSIEAS